MIWRPWVCLLASASLSLVAAAQLPNKKSPPFSFEQFHVTTYKGPLKIPGDVHKTSVGVWRDDVGKLVEDPRVNFAGEYDLAAHSCGTCCRYYTLNDLASGRKYKDISMFDTGDAPSRTKDGHTYVSILYYKPDSRLLIVQYELDLCTDKQEACRQRDYVFKNGRFRALSNTLMSCTSEGDEP